MQGAVLRPESLELDDLECGEPWPLVGCVLG
jgi:hypothetical protein